MLMFASLAIPRRFAYPFQAQGWCVSPRVEAYKQAVARRLLSAQPAGQAPTSFLARRLVPMRERPNDERSNRDQEQHDQEQHDCRRDDRVTSSAGRPEDCSFVQFWAFTEAEGHRAFFAIGSTLMRPFLPNPLVLVGACS